MRIPDATQQNKKTPWLPRRKGDVPANRTRSLGYWKARIVLIDIRLWPLRWRFCAELRRHVISEEFQEWCMLRFRQGIQEQCREDINQRSGEANERRTHILSMEACGDGGEAND